MRDWLTWTGWAELLNVALLPAAVWTYAALYSSPVGIRAVGAVFLAGLILLQGGLYWLLKGAGVVRRTDAVTRVRVLRALYGLNMMLLLVLPVIALAVPQRSTLDSVLGAVLYVLAFGEFIHYFVFKINMRSREMKRTIAERRPQPARMLRELRVAARAVGRQELD